MDSLYLFLAVFFLLWTFVVTTQTYAIGNSGETLFLGIVKKYKRRFAYLPFHKLFFKSHDFKLLVFASSLAENVGRLGYATVVLLLFLSWPLLSWHLLLLLMVALLLILFVGDFLPRLLATKAPEQALSLSLPLASLFLYLSFPFTFFFLKWFEKNLKKEDSAAAYTPFEEMKETIVQILQAANVKERLNTSDKKLIESVIKFKERIVREVMVPRVDLFCLSVTTTIKEAARLLVREGYSRVPVYKETIDNIIGVLMFKDVLQLYMNCEMEERDKKLLDSSIESIVKSVFYTPETKRVSQLLQEFRTKQVHMAIVVDEYGGTEGVVTIEDILEEIVGEIADEYDIDEETLYSKGPGSGSWIVDARMSILDAEETFGIHIPEEGDYDTIGGYIFHKVGSIPPRGLKIHHEDFDLEILSASERSVDKVKITPRRASQ